MSELVPALKDTLFSPTYEIVAEYAEIGIDALWEVVSRFMRKFDSGIWQKSITGGGLTAP